MKVRPSHIWLVPTLLFGISTARWAAFTGLFAYHGELEWPRDYHGLMHIYLPLLASVFGLSVAMLAAWIFWSSVLRINLWALAIYALTFLSWGIVDIHFHHCQAFHCDLQVGDSHEDYWTWWFAPQGFVP